MKMRWRSGGIALVALAVLAVGMSEVGAAREPRAAWKGAETLQPIALAPSPERCGPPPVNLEGRFTGTGLDSVGGAFVVTASGCLDTEALRLFDLEATDTYSRSGASLKILPDDVELRLDPSTCIAVNRRPVPFKVGGGTGLLEDATGHGTFHIALSYPPCGGTDQPAHLWFKGKLHLQRAGA